MKHSKISSSFIILSALLGVWISLPNSYTDPMRSFTISSCTPFWNLAHTFKLYLADRPTYFWQKPVTDTAKILKLELDNALLRAQVEKLSELAFSEEQMRIHWGVLKDYEHKEKEVIREEDRQFFKLRKEVLSSLIQTELFAMPAEIIYRSPSSWGSSCWINIGEKENRNLGRTIIAKNSPVLAGASLVGVIEYVGEKQSRVRLITDAELFPAVRATRGLGADRELLTLLQPLSERLQARGESSEELKKLQEKYRKTQKENYLAKGQIQGSSHALFRTLSPLLKGIGFNFDFTDGELRQNQEIAVIAEGDLLVTTGFDGVFPPDLPVGIVKKVNPPKMGGHVYDLEVLATAHNLADLTTVFVLPPRGD